MKRTMSSTLRAVAEFIEAHPDIPVPYVAVYDHRPDLADVSWYLHINDNAKDAADQKAKAAAILKAVGGKWDKNFTSDARFTQSRDGLNFDVVVAREAVCTPRVVATETVTIPAVEAKPERTEERPVIEWDCAPVLAEQVSA